MWFVALVAVDYSQLSFIREITNVVDIEYLLFYTRVMCLVSPKEKYRVFHKHSSN